jgi:hypothetical protein
MPGQVYIAGTTIGQGLAQDERVKIFALLASIRI